MKKVLVVGGAGYIGSHTVVALANRGYEPVIVDNFYNADPKVLAGLTDILGKKVSLRFADAKNYQELAQIVHQEGGDIHGIIHFAAYKYVNESLSKPLDYYRNNLDSLLNALQLAVDFHIPGLIFSSSCTVYGAPTEAPVKESALSLGLATNPYGKSKEMGERICEDVAKRYEDQLRVLSLRYFNPIGAHPSGLLGELPTRETQNLVPILLEIVRGERKSIKIFGEDFDTPDGTCVRDFVHVMDVAEAHVTGLEYAAQRRQSSAYDFINIGTGTGTSVRQVVEGFQRLNDFPLEVEVTERRAGDVPAVYADTTKAKSRLGWKAQYTVDEALVHAYQWTRHYLGTS
ncbi:MAG TPA: UDP-glucose 4-epimerase GalE [Cytophagales bacterium]|nr:UDP-glucose 4-epimerase GalE [Cytophagales bacterium]HAA18386.1 UDP-glucose 4-epimerase GalE [Cytophagales bacterium]HAP61434.1 UDP-glucose 4-epimerase GalE [Cytophagales bacterium]